MIFHRSVYHALNHEKCNRAVELVRLVELPAWHGPIVAGEQVEAVVAVIGEQAQVGNDSVYAVVNDDFILPVAIEVADVELVVSGELPGAWHNGNRIEDDVQLRVIGAVECPTGCATRCTFSEIASEEARQASKKRLLGAARARSWLRGAVTLK